MLQMKEQDKTPEDKTPEEMSGSKNLSENGEMGIK